MRLRSPRVLAYSHDGYGLGHLRRNLRLLNGLRRLRADLDALLVTGAKVGDRLAAPFGLECVRLPPVIKVGNGNYVADVPNATFEEVVRRRSAIIADAVRQFQPDLLLVDRYPRGMREELAVGLELHASQSERPAVLGFRDILDSPHAIEREWRTRGYGQVIRDTYSTVLCYGDPAVYDPVFEYGLCEEVAERIRFTGYLADDLLARNPLEVRRAHAAEHTRMAVCALGGGKDAAHIAQAFLTAMERLHRRGWSGVLITGPYMASGDFARLCKHPAGQRVKILRMVDDLPSYLAAADVAVCMGGYNTTCELIGLAVPAVVIPRVQPRQEQLMRVQRLAARGLLSWLHPDQLCPDILADSVERQAAVGRPDLAANMGTIAHNGIATAARYLATLLPGSAPDDATDVVGRSGHAPVESGIAGP